MHDISGYISMQKCFQCYLLISDRYECNNLMYRGVKNLKWLYLGSNMFRRRRIKYTLGRAKSNWIYLHRKMVSKGLVDLRCSCVDVWEWGTMGSWTIVQVQNWMTGYAILTNSDAPSRGTTCIVSWSGQPQKVINWWGFPSHGPGIVKPNQWMIGAALLGWF